MSNRFRKQKSIWMEIRSRLSAHRAKPSPCLPFSWVGGKKHRHFVSITKLPGFVSWLCSWRLGVCRGGKLLAQHSRYSNMGVSTIRVLCPNGYRKSTRRLGVYLAWNAQQHRKQDLMHCIPIIQHQRFKVILWSIASLRKAWDTWDQVS